MPENIEKSTAINFTGKSHGDDAPMPIDTPGGAPSASIGIIFIFALLIALGYGHYTRRADGRISRNFAREAALLRVAVAQPTPESHSSDLAMRVETQETSRQRTPQTELNVRQKIDALLAEMTTEEKIGQLVQSFVPTQPMPKQQGIEERIARGEIGGLVDVLDPAEVNRLQQIAIQKSRLHIPILFGVDVVHGYHIMFPVPLGLAATWDMKLIEQSEEQAAQEARSDGIGLTYSPMLDIARDPRWGRIVEGPGEDPYLASRIAEAEVKGFQGVGPIDDSHLIACEKHFVGYGASEGGRDHDAVNLSESQLRNVYLQPFKAGVRVGAGCVMSAYMDLNDVPATGNRWLLTDVLRKEWGFTGFVVSDNNAVLDLVPHGFAKDNEDAAIRALEAGVDIQMSFRGNATGLLSASRNGKIRNDVLNQAVRRVLEAKIRLGLFEHPYAAARGEDADILARHRESAKIAAEKSAVLLRNESHLLPLQPERYDKIAVIGPLADTRQNTLGSWAFAQDMEKVTTVYQGISKQAGFKKVRFAQGVQIKRGQKSPFEGLMKESADATWTEAQSAEEFKKAVSLARESDISVLVLGELQDMTGESASRAQINLPGDQEKLLEAVASIGKPIVIVLLNGRPLDIRWAASHVPAILEMWYPGSAGGDAVADLLFGRAVPGGKLPLSWPSDASQIPIYYSHTLTQDPQNQSTRYWDEPSRPLFPFGFGLSYTDFAYQVLNNHPARVRRGESITLSAKVENIGDVDGDAVVQLYVHQRFGSASRPSRELKGFERIFLRAHEKKVVEFTLRPEDLSYWSTATKSRLEESSNFDFWIGADSNASEHGTFSVTEN
jgi:beta-glucosidase